MVLGKYFFSQSINICNFADDTTPFLCNVTVLSVLDNLEGNSELAIFWLENHYMKLNTDKCLLLVSATKYEHSWGKTGDDKIWEGDEVKLLSIIIDNKL